VRIFWDGDDAIIADLVMLGFLYRLQPMSLHRSTRPGVVAAS
jgi:hypothetical protein